MSFKFFCSCSIVSFLIRIISSSNLLLRNERNFDSDFDRHVQNVDFSFEKILEKYFQSVCLKI
jgi:hypothetical protein